MTRTRTIAATATATAVIGGSLVAGTGTAGAVDIHPQNGGRTTAIILTHAETVTAAQIGAGNVINAVLGNDRWQVTLAAGSRYNGGDYYRPDKARIWNNVTGQQLVEETAAHPGGHVALGVTPTNPSYPLWVQQVW